MSIQPDEEDTQDVDLDLHFEGDDLPEIEFEVANPTVGHQGNARKRPPLSLLEPRTKSKRARTIPSRLLC